MIDISQLRSEDIGRWVLYNDGFRPPEKGRLKSWNDQFIFVVYHCAGQWHNFQNYTGCATSPEDLQFTTLQEIV